MGQSVGGGGGQREQARASCRICLPCQCDGTDILVDCGALPPNRPWHLGSLSWRPKWQVLCEQATTNLLFAAFCWCVLVHMQLRACAQGTPHPPSPTGLFRSL